MKRILTLMMLALAVASGCSDDGGGDGDGDGDGSGNGSGDTSSSSNCDSQHSCINGACQCDAGPKKGQSCCDPDDSSCTENKCDTFCEYCS